MLHELSVYWIKSPLKKPYKLSFSSVKEFDSFFILLENQYGLFWGETTALPGYSWETPENIWEIIHQCLEASGNRLYTLSEKAESLIKSFPFAVTPILTALEKWFNIESFKDCLGIEKIPLIGIVQSQSLDELEEEVNGLIKSGHKILKVKLSKNIDDDIDRLKIIQNLIGSEIRLRLDANQAYDNRMAERIINTMDTDKIELLEQPFPREQWDWTESLTKWSPIPIMLDESIWNLEDIARAARIGAQFVKLKLVKHGSILRTTNLILKAKQFGLNVILGNGVQTHFGCIDECCIYNLSGITTHSEMNGFQKIKKSLNQSITFENGYIVFKNDLIFKSAKDFRQFKNICYLEHIYSMKE